MTEQTGEGRETRSFEAEVSKLLSLMVHSVYSNRDVFLRELDLERRRRLREAAGTQPSGRRSSSPRTPISSITLGVRQDRRHAHRVGQRHRHDRDELVDNLGTIARSGTRAFVDGDRRPAGSESSSALIGQFGVGFYSAFIVAKSVTVTSPEGRLGRGVALVIGRLREPSASSPRRSRRARPWHARAAGARRRRAQYADEDTIERVVAAHCGPRPGADRS
jgi:hypothetical protein